MCGIKSKIKMLAQFCYKILLSLFVFTRFNTILFDNNTTDFMSMSIH